jgi:hypothetical protein
MIEELEQALKAMENALDTLCKPYSTEVSEAIVSLRQLIDQVKNKEPFGYFRPEPFGWTDCSKDDEGAIALYETPRNRPMPKELVKLYEDYFDKYFEEHGRKPWAGLQPGEPMKIWKQEWEEACHGKYAGLPDSERKNMVEYLADAIEAKLKERNT